MQFDFDMRIDRKHTDCIAADGWKSLFAGQEITLPCPEDQLIPMWIADMSFATPAFILDAIRRRLDRQILGYTRPADSTYFDTFSAWTDLLYGWHWEPEDLFFSNGIVSALNELARLLCGPGDKILFQTPAYGPFLGAVKTCGAEPLFSRLVLQDGVWRTDLEDFARKAADPAVKLCLLCSPHNPTGRVWKREELLAVGQICVDNGLIVVSDEIHCDILRAGMQHIPLVSLFPDYKKIITCMAPSKTFNMAGMQFSNVLIRDPELRSRWSKVRGQVVNPLSLAAATGAYAHGYDWLVAMRRYLDGNYAALQAVLRARLPELTFRIPEGTYLAWIDLRPYLPPDADPVRFFAERAGVLLEAGRMFVDNADGFIRLNLACPRSVMTEAAERICSALGH